mgnify:CR=1 FL=1
MSDLCVPRADLVCRLGCFLCLVHTEGAEDAQDAAMDDACADVWMDCGEALLRALPVVRVRQFRPSIHLRRGAQRAAAAVQEVVLHASQQLVPQQFHAAAAAAAGGNGGGPAAPGGLLHEEQQQQFLLGWQQHVAAAAMAVPGGVGNQWAGAPPGTAGVQQQGPSEWMEPEYMI